MVVDELVRRWGAPSFRDKFKAEFTKVAVGDNDVVLLKPMTFMNLSGESVQAAMRFFKVPLGQVVCVHDELDLEFGVVRIKVGGGTAGHNGLALDGRTLRRPGLRTLPDGHRSAACGAVPRAMFSVISIAWSESSLEPCSTSAPTWSRLRCATERASR